MQTQIDRLAPLLETLPQTDTADSDDDVPLDNWRQAHDECVSLQSQLQTLQEQTTQEQQRAAEAIAHFDAALKIACLTAVQRSRRRCWMKRP